MVRRWTSFLLWALGVPIRIKIMGIALGLTLLLGMGGTVQVHKVLTARLQVDLERRGLSIAEDLALHIGDRVLANDRFTLYETLKGILRNNEDVSYAFICDSAGRPFAYTFAGGVPPEILALNAVKRGEAFGIQSMMVTGGVVHDVAVPIFDGRFGTVRVGMSEAHLKETVDAVIRRFLVLAALTSLVGVGAAYLLTAALTRPIHQLVEIARSIGEGDFQKKADVWAGDEIGQLGEAINAMTEDLSRSRVELREKEEMRLRLLKRLISAQEDERQRVSRELHDQTSQSLTSLMLGLRILEMAGTMEEAKGRIAELRSLVESTLEDVHRLALELRPSILDSLGLLTALQQYAQDFSTRSGLAVDFHASGFEEGSRLPPQVEVTLYRIVQEALTNVARHARPQRVSVLLQRRGPTVRAIVEDDGVGFDAASLLPSHERGKRLGLFGMEERAALVGGRLTVESSPGGGTTVLVETPIDTAKEEDLLHG